MFPFELKNNRYSLFAYIKNGRSRRNNNTYWKSNQNIYSFAELQTKIEIIKNATRSEMKWKGGNITWNHYFSFLFMFSLIILSNSEKFYIFRLKNDCCYVAEIASPNIKLDEMNIKCVIKIPSRFFAVNNMWNANLHLAHAFDERKQ